MPPETKMAELLIEAFWRLFPASEGGPDYSADSLYRRIHHLNPWGDDPKPERVTKGRFRPCGTCGRAPYRHNANRADYVGHEYR